MLTCVEQCEHILLWHGVEISLVMHLISAAQQLLWREIELIMCWVSAALLYTFGCTHCHVSGIRVINSVESANAMHFPACNQM